MARAEQGLGDHTVEALINKVAALLKVYYTVMLCLGHNISVLRGGPVTVEYLSEVCGCANLIIFLHAAFDFVYKLEHVLFFSS